jgi:hypothetical protein
MDFRGREVDFQGADRRYEELKRQRDGGSISEEEFDEQLKNLMVQDESGRWWVKSRKSGAWHYNDGNAWVPGTPPDRQQSISGLKRGRPDVQHDYAPEPTVHSTEVRAKVWLGLAIACAVITVPGFMILMVTFLNLLARPPLEGGPLVGGGIILIVFLQLLVGSLGVFFSLLTIRAGRPKGGKLTYLINGMGLLEALAVVLVVLAHVLAGYMNTSSEKPSSEKPSSEKPSSEKPSSEKPSSEKPSSDPDSEDKNSSELSRIVNDADRMESDLPGKTISEAGPIAGGDYKLRALIVDPSPQPKGTIIEANGPTTVNPDRITLTLSGGGENVTVPDVSGLSALQAGKVLLDAGLEPNVTVYFDQSGNAVTATSGRDDAEETDVSTRKITGTFEEAGSVVPAGNKILLEGKEENLR